MYAISLIYDVDYQQLAQWNQIPPPYKIEVGQKIRLSDPNPGHPARADEKAAIQVADAKPQLVAPAQTNKSSPPKNVPIQPAVINLKPALVNKTPDKLPVPTQDSTEKPGNSPQKKSIISIDNESMLKLNFQWPIKGKILKPFAHADNKGIDIAGEKGQNVKAAEAGKVVYSGQGLFGYGNLLIIKHNDLYLSAYANNSQLLVEEGHTVKKGEVVAKVGQTESKRASLHFEIRKNGKPVNPMVFLPGK
ncbi:MAG: peptidoglycan DD-metalloendopeptidase family protein [Methylobacter sp.]